MMEKIKHELENGGAVVLPTETVYGLFAKALDKKAVDHVLEANDRVPYWVNSNLTTVGFRMPSHPLTLELIREFGPLIGPSANISGQSSGVDFHKILQNFDQVVLGLEDDAFLTGQDSTILDLSGDKVKILRQGAITREDILAKIPAIPFEEV